MSALAGQLGHGRRRGRGPRMSTVAASQHRQAAGRHLRAAGYSVRGAIRDDRLAAFCIFVIAAFTLIAIAAPLLAPHEPEPRQPVGRQPGAVVAASARH